MKMTSVARSTLPVAANGVWRRLLRAFRANSYLFWTRARIDQYWRAFNIWSFSDSSKVIEEMSPDQAKQKQWPRLFGQASGGRYFADARDDVCAETISSASAGEHLQFIMPTKIWLVKQSGFFRQQAAFSQGWKKE